MPFALLPNAAAAAAGQARLLARGASPQLMTSPDDDFLSFNAWLTPTPSANIGAPNNELGFPEAVAELFGFELLRPEQTVEGMGGVVIHFGGLCYPICIFYMYSTIVTHVFHDASEYTCKYTRLHYEHI